MSRITLAGRSSIPTTDLDSNFTELYGFAKNLISDGSGNVLVAGKTTVSTTEAGAFFESAPSNGYGRANFVKASSSGTGPTLALAFYYAGTQIGFISCSSTVIAVNGTSDRRLKKDIRPADNAGAVLDAIRVVAHGWLHDPDAQVRWGFVAQDLHEVMPEAVTVGDDGLQVEQAWGVDKGALVPLLVLEIQAIRRRLAALEART